MRNCVLFLVLALSTLSCTTADSPTRGAVRRVLDEERKGKGGGSSKKKKKDGKKEKGCNFMLTNGGTNPGTAEATVTPNGLTVEYRGAVPNTLYTIWIDYKSRSTGELADDYPVEGGSVALTYTGPGIGRGVAPCIATTDPVYEGMKIDLNGVVTDNDGDATIELDLDFDLLSGTEGPVVAASLSMAGGNRLGGSWLRVYEGNVVDGASSQVLEGEKPKVVRATPAGLTIVGHFIPVSHGHTPGVGGVDHFSGYFSDFPDDCTV